MRSANGNGRPITSGQQHRVFWLLCSICLALVGVASLLVFTPAAMAQDPTPEPQVYEVQPGDTLFSIAQQFGSSVEAIAAANGITNPSLINPGQKLIIPTVEEVHAPATRAVSSTRVHPVRPGEELPALAFRYGTTVWALRVENELNRLGLLWPGLELQIPPPSAQHSGTPAFPLVGVSPDTLLQGDTAFVEVVAGADLELSGSLLGQELTFMEEEGRYWALAGINALTAPGGYTLMLEATEMESGDRLTMQEQFTVTKAGFGTYNVVVSEDRQGLLAAEVTEAERVKVNAAFAGVSEEQLWSGTFGLPLAGEIRVTAQFGQRRSYNGGPVASYHSGQDLGADKGVPVLAPMTGTVVLAEPLEVRGRAVILDHGLGVFTGFWHLSQIDVTVGQTVGRGEVVGLVGNSGLSTGPHLHWEMRVLNVPVDPFQWTRVVFPAPLPGSEAEPATPEPTEISPQPTDPGDG
jgi:murein DD-endopeptidase MepM/ murein hydrolase activator NlpD